MSKVKRLPFAAALLNWTLQRSLLHEGEGTGTLPRIIRQVFSSPAAHYHVRSRRRVRRQCCSSQHPLRCRRTDLKGRSQSAQLTKMLLTSAYLGLDPLQQQEQEPKVEQQLCQSTAQKLSFTDLKHRSAAELK